MLADPQAVTVAGTALSLARVGIGQTSADYQTADGASRLRVQQSSNAKTRRTSVTLQTDKVAADPLTAVNARVTSQISVSILQPINGFTVTELRDQLIGLANALTASTGAMTVKILGGEK